MRLLLGLGLLLAATLAHAGGLVGKAELNTGDKVCPYNAASPVYQETWTNTFGRTVYLRRAYTILWGGGNLTPQWEGWMWVGDGGGMAIVQMGGASFQAPTLRDQMVWDLDGIDVAPGETLTLSFQCVGYGPTAKPPSQTVVRALATFWLYDAP